eukprot:12730826-Ditylum_brightwellii.AAC.1
MSKGNDPMAKSKQTVDSMMGAMAEVTQRVLLPKYPKKVTDSIKIYISSNHWGAGSPGLHTQHENIITHARPMKCMCCGMELSTFTKQDRTGCH